MINITDKVNGYSGPQGQLSAEEINAIKNELMNLAQMTGLSLSDADDSQLAKVMDSVSKSSIYVQTGGTGDAIIVTRSMAGVVDQNLPLSDGMMFMIKPTITNTTGAPTLSVPGNTSRTITKADYTSALAVGDIVSGNLYVVIYNATNDVFGLIPLSGSSSGSGLTDYLPEWKAGVLYPYNSLVNRLGRPVRCVKVDGSIDSDPFNGSSLHWRLSTFMQIVSNYDSTFNYPLSPGSWIYCHVDQSYHRLNATSEGNSTLNNSDRTLIISGTSNAVINPAFDIRHSQAPIAYFYGRVDGTKTVQSHNVTAISTAGSTYYTLDLSESLPYESTGAPEAIVIAIGYSGTLGKVCVGTSVEEPGYANASAPILSVAFQDPDGAFGAAMTSITVLVFAKTYA